MPIDWESLLRVVVVSGAAAVAMVVLVALAITASAAGSRRGNIAAGSCLVAAGSLLVYGLVVLIS